MKTLPANGILADVNLWLATVVEAHPHHVDAKNWWSQRVLRTGARVAFCRITQLGFLRLLTNASVMGKQRCTVPRAWQVYGQLAAQRLVTFAREPKRLDEVLTDFTKLGGSSRNFWTDAYLAAFARTGALTLATFDKGFDRFPDLELHLISARSS
jgi:uncharacterized protein